MLDLLFPKKKRRRKWVGLIKEQLVMKEPKPTGELIYYCIGCGKKKTTKSKKWKREWRRRRCRLTSGGDWGMVASSSRNGAAEEAAGAWTRDLGSQTPRNPTTHYPQTTNLTARPYSHLPCSSSILYINYCTTTHTYHFILNFYLDPNFITFPKKVETNFYHRMRFGRYLIFPMNLIIYCTEFKSVMKIRPLLKIIISWNQLFLVLLQASFSWHSGAIRLKKLRLISLNRFTAHSRTTSSLFRYYIY